LDVIAALRRCTMLSNRVLVKYFGRIVYLGNQQAAAASHRRHIPTYNLNITAYNYCKLCVNLISSCKNSSKHYSRVQCIIINYCTHNDNTTITKSLIVVRHRSYIIIASSVCPPLFIRFGERSTHHGTSFVYVCGGS